MSDPDAHGHGHSHGLVDPSIKRSREGLRAYVSLGVIASAIVVAIGFDLADPLIGLGITLLILWITWDSWRTVKAGIHSY